MPQPPERAQGPAPAVLTPDEVITPGAAKWSQRRAAAFLQSCPRRMVTIERSNDDIRHEQKTGAPVYQFFGWNGWAYYVPKGVPTEVPEPIAQLVDQDRDLYRTSQAREARTLFNDIGSTMGPQVQL